MDSKIITSYAIRLHKTIEKTIATISHIVKQGDSNSDEFDITIDMVGHGFRPFGAKPGEGSYIDYDISVNKETVVTGLKDKWEVKHVFDELAYRLEKTKRKYKNATFVTTKASFDSTYTCFDYPHTVIIMNEPCAEFVKVRNLIRKYTETELSMTDLYAVRVGYDGGIYRGELGRRRYLCFDKEYCQSVLDFLHKRKDTRYRFKIGFHEYNDVDQADIRSSAYNLDWVYGMGYRKIFLEMRTPNNHVHRFE